MITTKKRRFTGHTMTMSRLQGSLYRGAYTNLDRFIYPVQLPDTIGISYMAEGMFVCV